MCKCKPCCLRGTWPKQLDWRQHSNSASTSINYYTKRHQNKTGINWIFFLQKLPSAPDEWKKRKGTVVPFAPEHWHPLPFKPWLLMQKQRKKTTAGLTPRSSPVCSFSKTVSLLIMLNEHSFCRGLACTSSDHVNLWEHE